MRETTHAGQDGIRSNRWTSGRGKCSGAAASVGSRAIAALHCCDDPIAPGGAPVALDRAGAAFCDPIIPELLDLGIDAHAGHPTVEGKSDLTRRGVPIARELRSAGNFGRARLRSVASGNASPLEEFDEPYSFGSGAAVSEMIAQFGCDRRGWSGSVDKVELGLRFACLIFSASHHAALAKMGERDENRLRGHSADRWMAISGKLAHPTRFERVTFAFGEVAVSESREWFATPRETLLASMARIGRVCQSNLL